MRPPSRNRAPLLSADEPQLFGLPFAHDSSGRLSVKGDAFQTYESPIAQSSLLLDVLRQIFTRHAPRTPNAEDLSELPGMPGLWAVCLLCLGVLPSDDRGSDKPPLTTRMTKQAQGLLRNSPL